MPIVSTITSYAAERSHELYERCLELFPEPYRREYGPLMSQAFGDQLQEMRTQPRLRGLIDLWMRTMADIAVNAAREHMQEWRMRYVESKKRLDMLVDYHIAEVACAALALLVSFSAFSFGTAAGMTTTAVATIVAAVIASLLDGKWRRQRTPR